MYELQVEGMSCGGCAGRVTRAIQSVDAGAKVEVDLKAKLVRIASSAEAQTVASAVTRVGYPARVIA